MNKKFSAQMFLCCLTLGLFSIFAFAEPSFAQSNYFPSAVSWERRTPEQAKMDAAKLKEAIDFAIASEAKAPRDMELSQTQTFGREPFGEIIGATKPRGAMTGIIIRNGYIVAEWGEPFRVDMTHSVTKSFLSTVVGLAYDRGLINDLNSRRSPSPKWHRLSPIIQTKNLLTRRISANRNLLIYLKPNTTAKSLGTSMLRQTSDWEGTLWGKPDWADRPDKDANNWLNRKRSEPGAVYEYNDVRVNALALAALKYLAQTASASLKRKHNGRNRRVKHLALVRLRKFVCRPRRANRAISQRRRTLGRRNVYLGARYGAFRTADRQ